MAQVSRRWRVERFLQHFDEDQRKGLAICINTRGYLPKSLADQLEQKGHRALKHLEQTACIADVVQRFLDSELRHWLRACLYNFPKVYGTICALSSVESAELQAVTLRYLQWVREPLHLVVLARPPGSC